MRKYEYISDELIDTLLSVLDHDRYVGAFEALFGILASACMSQLVYERDEVETNILRGKILAYKGLANLRDDLFEERALRIEEREAEGDGLSHGEAENFSEKSVDTKPEDV